MRCEQATTYVRACACHRRFVRTRAERACTRAPVPACSLAGWAAFPPPRRVRGLSLGSELRQRYVAHSQAKPQVQAQEHKPRVTPKPKQKQTRMRDQGRGDQLSARGPPVALLPARADWRTSTPCMSAFAGVIGPRAEATCVGAACGAGQTTPWLTYIGSVIACAAGRCTPTSRRRRC